MFYKNSQNCKVQSSRLHWRNHRSTEQSLQAEFEGAASGPWSLCLSILAWGPWNSLAALLETCHELHLSFSNVSFWDTPFFVNGDDVTIAIPPADLVAHLKLPASSEVWHTLIVNVLILTPPGGRQVFFHVGAALLIGRVSQVGHACVKRVPVGGLDVVLRLSCQLRDVAVRPLGFPLLLGLVEKGVSPLRNEWRLQFLVVELQPWVVTVH